MFRLKACVFFQEFSDLHVSSGETEDWEQNGMEYKVCLFLFSVLEQYLETGVGFNHVFFCQKEETSEDQSQSAT